MAEVKILLVESNPRVVEMLVESFVRRFQANITCVSTAEDALDTDMLEPHNIVLADTALPGMDAVTLTLRLKELCDRPVILMGSDPTSAEVIEATRCGAEDFFPKPFEVEALLQAMARELDGYEQARQLAMRHRRLRALVKRVIRERRELHDRMELVCKDLVGAHKRLVMRVLDEEGQLRADRK